MLTFAFTSQTYWYLTRSTGAVALLLLTGIVVLGTLGPIRLAGTARWPRFVVGRMHRDLSLLALAVLAVHIVTSVLDTFAPIGWLDAVVPLHSAYRPLWLGFGAVAFDLLVALIVTSRVRRRLGYERWRNIHWLAYAAWPVAVLHGLGSGSDVKSTWLLWITIGCGLAVVAAVLVRIACAETATGNSRLVWSGAALLAPVAIAVFALLGPLQPGWAARAGTPARDLHEAGAAAAASAAHPPVLRPRAEPFSAALQGSVQHRSVAGGGVIDLMLTLRGSTPGILRVRLAGTTVRGGGLSLIGSQVDLSAPALGAVLSGSVDRLSGPRLRARVAQSGGDAYELYADLAIDTGAGTVSGRLRAIPVPA